MLRYWFVVHAMVVAFFCPGAGAQQPGRGPTTGAPAAGRGAGARGPQVVSPEVRPDRTVVFRLLAPDAKTVTISGDLLGGKPPAALTKDDSGVWSITIGPLEPEIYTYSFNLDGAIIPDPRNTFVKPSTGYTSQVEVPGPGPQFYDARPGPHGDVRMVLYESKSLGGITRRLRVYTPPDYDTGKKKYPVLYLLHGASDWEVAWTDVGRAHIIMDNLILDGKAKPMIVVMPTIYLSPAIGIGPAPAGQPAAPRAATPAGGPPQDDGFTKDLLQDIMPFVAKKFRVLTGPDNTAIAGLSMGGAQTLRTGLAHLDTFHYVLGLSSAVGMGLGRGRSGAPATPSAAPPDPTAAYPALMSDVAGNNKKLKLFWISCGKDDSLAEGNKALVSALQAKGVKVSYKETEGAHWWMVWRWNLRDLAPLLFR